MGDDATKLRVISSDLLAQASGTFRNAAVEAAITLNLLVEFAQHLSLRFRKYIVGFVATFQKNNALQVTPSDTFGISECKCPSS